MTLKERVARYSKLHKDISTMTKQLADIKELRATSAWLEETLNTPVSGLLFSVLPDLPSLLDKEDPLHKKLLKLERSHPLIFLVDGLALNVSPSRKCNEILSKTGPSYSMYCGSEYNKEPLSREVLLGTLAKAPPGCWNWPKLTIPIEWYDPIENKLTIQLEELRGEMRDELGIS